VFDQLLDELQSSPDATVSDERSAVRAISDSRLKFFLDVNTHNRHIYRNGAVHNGDIARGGNWHTTVAIGLRNEILFQALLGGFPGVDRAAKTSKHRLSRDFQRRSIFDFCNSICQKQKSPSL
jgi:hypothetical protein